MTVLEAIRKRYSCRSYKEKPIEQEKLEEPDIVVTRDSPLFVVVTDGEAVSRPGAAPKRFGFVRHNNIGSFKQVPAGRALRAGESPAPHGYCRDLGSDRFLAECLFSSSTRACPACGTGAFPSRRISLALISRPYSFRLARL
jgi:hypothetical protein